MKKALIITGILAALVLLAAAGVGIWAYDEFLHTEPLTKAELAELTVDWDEVTGGNWSPWVDAGDGTKEWNPAASYNAWLASVPGEEKAWPGMVRAHFIEPDLVYEKHLGTLPTDPVRWDSAASIMSRDTSDAIAAELHEALSKPILGCGLGQHWDPVEHAAMTRVRENDPEAFDPGPLEFDSTANTPLFDAMMPWLGRLSRNSKFLASRAAYQLETGDKEQFLSDVELMTRSSNLASESPLLISNLVDVGIEAKGHELVSWALKNHEAVFDEHDLARVERALADQDRVSMPWQGEAIAFHDAMRRLADSRGGLGIGEPERTEFGELVLGEPVSIPDEKLRPSLQRTLLVYNRILRASAEASKVPWDETAPGPLDHLDDAKEDLNYFGNLYLGILAPATELASARFREHRQSSLALRLAIAAHRHNLRHGSFPESIDAIDDDLIDFDPIDAFTGEPLGYTLTESGPLVYSVGPDRIDNGGRQGWQRNTAWDGSTYRVKKHVEWWSQAQAQALAGNEDAQWDWVLFPVPPDENPPAEEEYDPDWDLKQDGTYEDVNGEEPEPTTDG